MRNPAVSDRVYGPDVTFRLRAAHLDFWVDVRLRRSDERWVAVANIGGENEVGLGGDPPSALSAALSSLGPMAITALRADPALLAPSCLLRMAELDREPPRT